MKKNFARKRIPPKDSKPSIKNMYSDGKSKTYHWSPYHLQWTIHSPAECKRLNSTKGKKDYKDKKARTSKADNKHSFRQRQLMKHA